MNRAWPHWNRDEGLDGDGEGEGDEGFGGTGGLLDGLASLDDSDSRGACSIGLRAVDSRGEVGEKLLSRCSPPLRTSWKVVFTPGNCLR